jgi:hypothetical protein
LILIARVRIKRSAGVEWKSGLVPRPREFTIVRPGWSLGGSLSPGFSAGGPTKIIIYRLTIFGNEAAAPARQRPAARKK